MDWGFALGVVMTGALAGVAMARLSRRAVGAPVGWFRAFTVGVLVFLLWSPLATRINDEAQVASADGALQVSAAAVLALLLLALGWAFAIGIGILVVLEAIWPTGTVRNPWRWAIDVARGRRRWLRSFRVFRIMSKHGLRAALHGRRTLSTPEQRVETGRVLAAALDEAGVTFVKFGQMIASRPDLVPPEIRAELARLQYAAAPIDWGQARAVLDAELGDRWPVLLPEIEPQPLAAASTAQVHRAVSADGRRVVVKIQRPDAVRTVAVDIDLLETLAREASVRADWARAVDVVGLADGFAKSLREELDYTVEADRAATLRHLTPADSEVRIPVVLAEASGRRVLVMTEAAGRPVSAAGLDHLAPERRTSTARSLLQDTIRRVLVDGVFHADLHPGNVMIDDDGSLTLIDFGSVGVLDDRLRQLTVQLLIAVFADDSEAAAAVLARLVRNRDEVDVAAMRDDLGILLTFARTGTGGTEKLVAGLLDLFRVHRLAIPPQLAAALRTMAALEGTLTLIDPGFDLTAALREQAGTLLAPHAGSESGVTAASKVLSVLGSVRELPARLESVSWQLDSGLLPRRFRPLGNPAERRWLHTQASDALFTMLSGVAALVGVALLAVPGGPSFTPTVPFYTFLGWCLGLAAFTLGLRVLFRRLARQGERA